MREQHYHWALKGSEVPAWHRMFQDGTWEPYNAHATPAEKPPLQSLPLLIIQTIVRTYMYVADRIEWNPMELMNCLLPPLPWLHTCLHHIRPFRTSCTKCVWWSLTNCHSNHSKYRKVTATSTRLSTGFENNRVAHSHTSLSTSSGSPHTIRLTTHVHTHVCMYMCM